MRILEGADSKRAPRWIERKRKFRSACRRAISDRRDLDRRELAVI